MSTLQDEIGAMIDAGSESTEPPEPTEPIETPVVEPKQEPAPEPTPEPESTPELEQTQEPEPTTEPEPEPSAEPEPVDEPVDEVTKYKAENEALRKQLDELHGKKKSTEKPKPESEPEPAPESTPIADDVDFFSDQGEDFDPYDLVRDKDGLNKLLNKVYKAGIETTRNQLGESVLRNIPNIVRNNVELITTLRETRDEFYKENEDLKPFEKSVASVFEELSSENPDWTLDKCMEETGIETRKRLELHKVAPTKPDPKPSFPPATRGRSSGKQKPTTSALEKEIDAMNAELE